MLIWLSGFGLYDLKSILKRIAHPYRQLDKEDHDTNSSYLENLYWKVKTSFYNALQDVLQNDETKEYFISKIGSSLVDEYLTCDTSKFFYAQKLEPFDFENIEKKMLAFYKMLFQGHHNPTPA